MPLPVKTSLEGLRCWGAYGWSCKCFELSFEHELSRNQQLAIFLIPCIPMKNSTPFLGSLKLVSKRVNDFEGFYYGYTLVTMPGLLNNLDFNFYWWLD